MKVYVIVPDCRCGYWLSLRAGADSPSCDFRGQIAPGHACRRHLESQNKIVQKRLIEINHHLYYLHFIYNLTSKRNNQFLQITVFNKQVLTFAFVTNSNGIRIWILSTNEWNKSTNFKKVQWNEKVLM